MRTTRAIRLLSAAVALAGLFVAVPAMGQVATRAKAPPDVRARLAGEAETSGEPAPRPKGEIAVIETKFGNIEIAFFDASAPEHVKNFKQLAGARFFDGTVFHRVLPDFIIQGGDPNTKDTDPSNDGQGGPGYTLPAEIREKHVRGAIGSARITDATNPEKRSSGSQFYICLRDCPDLDAGGYTVFGRVIKGMDVVRKIAEQPTGRAGKPKDAVKMIRVSLASR